jgi:hypothetical protein
MAETTERELGWDDEIENDSSFTLFPEGDYPFVVESYSRARFAGSDKIPPCHQAVLTLQVLGGKEKGLGVQALTANLMLHSKMEWKLCEFFLCIGQRKHGEKLRMDWSKVPGASGMCHIIQVPGRKDPSRTFNQVDYFIDPEKSTPSENAPSYTAGVF